MSSPNVNDLPSRQIVEFLPKSKRNKTALVARPAVDPAGVGAVAPLPAGVVGTVGAWGKRLSFLPLSETEYLTPWTLISVVGFVPPAASGCLLLMPAAAVF